MPSVHVPDEVTIQVTQVARYRAFPETAGGFEVPNAETNDRHFYFSLPGAIALPAVIYYRTRHTGTPLFSVRFNNVHVTEYDFVDGDAAERTWHEIVPANAPVRPDNNELVFFVRDGSVVFGDVVILYTSDQSTVPVRITVVPAKP